MTALVNNILIPLVTICALTVLMALGKVDPNVGVAVIVGLAGVHVGANVASPTPPAVTKVVTPPRV